MDVFFLETVIARGQWLSACVRGADGGRWATDAARVLGVARQAASHLFRASIYPLCRGAAPSCEFAGDVFLRGHLGLGTGHKSCLFGGDMSWNLAIAEVQPHVAVERENDTLSSASANSLASSENGVRDLRAPIKHKLAKLDGSTDLSCTAGHRVAHAFVGVERASPRLEFVRHDGDLHPTTLRTVYQRINWYVVCFYKMIQRSRDRRRPVTHWHGEDPLRRRWLLHAKACVDTQGCASLWIMSCISSLVLTNISQLW